MLEYFISLKSEAAGKWTNWKIINEMIVAAAPKLIIKIKGFSVWFSRPTSEQDSNRHLPIVSGGQSFS